MLLRAAAACKRDDGCYAIHTLSGNPDLARDRAVAAHAIMSRPLYEKWGYFLYPGYDGMYSDDDFSEHAYADGVMIPAFDITLEHRHPAFGLAAEDDVYRWQNREEAYEMGKQLLEERRKRHFST
jgi:hypothetical protein